jgi:hypothetical protein
MGKRIIFAAFIFFPTVCTVIFAQTAAQAEASVPTVSQIRIESRNNMVRLRWIDSPDARGPVYVFKSAQPFNDVVPPDLVPVEVPYGSRMYVDETDGSGSVYYFVAASDGPSRRYDVFIPYTNMASMSFSNSAPVAAGMSAAEAPAAVEITDLAARVDGEKIIVSFNISGTEKKAVLYRSSHPIRQTNDLLNALIVQSAPVSPYTDRPVPGFSWYYALVFEDEITSGNVEISPGRNATVDAVVIATGRQEDWYSARSMPLPGISLSSVIPGGDYYSEMPAPAPLTRDTERILQDIPHSQPQPQTSLKPLIFTKDLETPAGGDESLIRNIVQGNFYKRGWDAARLELDNFLALPRSADIAARALFDRGQTYYCSCKWRDALMDFLYAQKQYPRELDKWVKSTLEKMIEKPAAP